MSLRADIISDVMAFLKMGIPRNGRTIQKTIRDIVYGVILTLDYKYRRNTRIGITVKIQYPNRVYSGCEITVREYGVSFCVYLRIPKNGNSVYLSTYVRKYKK